eukprot:4939218-Prymnesium_polylepis.1
MSAISAVRRGSAPELTFTPSGGLQRACSVPVIRAQQEWMMQAMIQVAVTDDADAALNPDVPLPPPPQQRADEANAARVAEQAPVKPRGLSRSMSVSYLGSSRRFSRRGSSCGASSALCGAPVSAPAASQEQTAPQYDESTEHGPCSATSHTAFTDPSGGVISRRGRLSSRDLEARVMLPQEIWLRQSLRAEPEDDE